VLVPAATGLTLDGFAQLASELPVVPQVSVWALLLVPTPWALKIGAETGGVGTEIGALTIGAGETTRIGCPGPGDGGRGGRIGGCGPLVNTRPVPLSPTICGLPVALSNMLRLPVLVPVAFGLKVTEIVQLAPALRLVPQVLVWEKSVKAVMLKIVSETLPVLVSLTVWAALLVPTI